MNNSFFKSFLELTGASVIAQLITIVCSPILTRYFSTSIIGEFTLILTAIGLFGSVICLRYDIAIVSEKEQYRTYCIIKLCLYLSLFLSVIIGIIYFFYYKYKEISFNKRFLYCVFISILLFLTGINNILVSYNNRNKEYKLMSKTLLIRTIVKELVIVISIFINRSFYLLVIAQVLGTIYGIRKQAESLMIDSNNFKDIIKINLLDIKQMAFEYRKQAIYSTPSIFVNNFSYSSINYFIDFLYGTSFVGLYSISYRLLGLPLSLISGNISKIYLKDISNEHNNDKTYVNTFRRTSLLLLLISVPITIGLFVFAPLACSIFFGDSYYQAGIYVRYLAPMFGIRFIVSPLTVGVLISKKQRIEIIFQSLFGIFGIIIFVYTKILSLKIEKYLLLISISYSIIYILYFLYLYKISKNM